MRRIIKTGASAAFLVVSAFLGALSAQAAIGAAREAGYVQDGGWRHRVAGAETGYALAAARQATPAPFSDAEMRLFIRSTDEDGRALREDCVYELAGRPAPARWWSATIYRQDGARLDNGDNAEHIRSDRLGDGRWRVRVAPVRGEAAWWLSSRGAGRFAIGVRVYHPLRDYREARAALPTLSRVSCADDAV